MRQNLEATTDAGPSTSSLHPVVTPCVGVDLRATIERGIRALYQPIVELQTHSIVAYEALARGPVDSPLEMPADLFGAARAQQLTGALDLACVRAAINGAAQARLRAPISLFVNIEPEVIGAEIDIADSVFLRDLPDDLQLFFEVTERSLTARPAELLETVERLRAHGLGIALDDVGADHRSLALLPLLRPDVVKLDMSLIHQHPSRQSGRVMNGVCAYAESTGASILAEGVETDRHLVAARSMGAQLAQGWYFGRPGALPASLSVPRVKGRATITLGLPPRRLPSSPAALVHERRGLRVGRKDVLLSITRALESQALELGEHGVIASAFQHAQFFTPATRVRYERLAARTSLTVALGEDLPAEPARGVRGARLLPDDQLISEWDVAVLGPHFAAALVARDLGRAGSDRDREFEFVVTFERDLVVDVIATLVSRLRSS